MGLTDLAALQFKQRRHFCVSPKGLRGASGFGAPKKACAPDSGGRVLASALAPGNATGKPVGEPGDGCCAQLPPIDAQRGASIAVKRVPDDLHDAGSRFLDCRRGGNSES